jgi:4-carboxymuconolactone decarboxylase
MPSPLPPSLCRLAVAVVRFLPHALDEFAAGAGPGPLTAEAREVVIQCHLFCGFPRTIAALDHLRSAGVPPGTDAAPPAAPGSPAAGSELFDRIYGESAPEVRAHLRSLDPDLAELVAEHAYGAVLSRGGLDARARELLAVVMLAATGHDRQLASHVRGAVRCGATPTEISDALDAVEDLVSPECMERARDVAARFTGTG